MVFGGFCGEAWDVGGPVFSGAQEERGDDDLGCAAFYAAGVGGGDGGLGDFHVGGFYDVIEGLETLAEKGGDFFEHLVALGAARSVIYDDDCGLHEWRMLARKLAWGKDGVEILGGQRQNTRADKNVRPTLETKRRRPRASEYACPCHPDVERARCITSP